MISVNILGYGNVGKHLSQALLELSGVELQEVYNRSLPTEVREDVAFIDTITDLKPADITILTVKDDAIGSVSKAIPYEGNLVVHTSGSMPMSKLDAKNRRGVFYPLQSFSKGSEIDFHTIPICIEAEDKRDLTLLRLLGEKLSKSVQEISSEERKKLHLAATWVNNFTNHIFHLAANYLDENGLSFDLLKPLILETARKIQEIHPSAAQTGPAIRRDSATLQNHLNQMSDPQLKEIYKLLTESIQNINK